jgi:hypothetical protein
LSKSAFFCMGNCRFDVEAAITSFGSPHWEKTHEAATKTAFVLETLKNRGATLFGKTVMDELGFRYQRRLPCSVAASHFAFMITPVIAYFVNFRL